MSGSDRVMRVLVVEDDPYARDFMAMLLIRDWRTQVEAEVATQADLQKFLEGRSRQIRNLDLMLLNVEHSQKPDWAYDLTFRARQLVPGMDVLFSSAQADPTALRKALTLGCRGYVLNSEVMYALAGVVRAAFRSAWVVSPGAWRLAHQLDLKLPSRTRILAAGRAFANMTPRERQVARLAILFNLRHAEIADELSISAGQVAKYVSTIYGILGLRELLDGTDDVKLLFDDDDLELRRRFIEVKQRAQQVGRARANSTAAPEKATLAFHLFTNVVELQPDQVR